MKISIECNCGEKYDTEFEPVNGLAPNPIICPNCGTDATESINAALQPPAAPPPRPPLRKAEPVPETGPPPLPPMPRTTVAPPVLAAPAPAAVETVAEVPTHCFRHTDKPVEMLCFVCKKPMCTECMEMYGFVCSPYCRRQAKEKGMEIPEYNKQRDVVARKSRTREKFIALGVGVAILALLGGWIWYEFWGSKPHVVRTVDLGQDGASYCRFIGPNQLLVAGARKITLYDTGAGKARWSTTSAETREEDYWGGLGGVFVTPEDIWLQRGQVLVRLDRQTGTEKGKVAVEGVINRVTQTESALVAHSPAGLHQTRLTHIDLASGQAKTDVANMLYVEEEERPVMRDWEPGSEEVDKPEPIVAKTDFVAAGPNVAQVNVQVVKTNIVSYQAIKDTGQQRADSEMKVSESIAIAEEILTDVARQKTGGVRWEDESQYAVTVRRIFVDGVVEWKGEVTGPPSLFASKTVDLLVAGKQLVVFNKQNQKLWESKLTYPVAGTFTEDDLGYGSESVGPPCLEVGDTLYFFDQGVLTAFALKDGQVRWRLASVGISQIELDPQGKLYVTTTTASPEDIQYTQQVKLDDRAETVILKVDPTTGQTLWKLEKKGDRFYLSEGFVYFTKISGSGLRDFANMVQGKAVLGNFRIFRIDPRKGKDVWEYHREGVPEHVAIQGRTIVLITDGQMEVLKYLTL